MAGRTHNIYYCYISKFFVIQHMYWAAVSSLMYVVLYLFLHDHIPSIKTPSVNYYYYQSLDFVLQSL
jgi:hypothetical protein